MAQCDYCGTTILFGGTREGDHRFCNEKCRNAGALLVASRQLSDDLIQKKVGEVHQGNCPRCEGHGPIDVHTSYRVFSALVTTSWSSRPHICCRSCGIKSQLTDTVFCLLLGWWGFPWGLIATPIQVGRNLLGVASGPDPAQPSSQLEKLVRMDIASEAAANQGESKPPPGINSSQG